MEEKYQKWTILTLIVDELCYLDQGDSFRGENGVLREAEYDNVVSAVSLLVSGSLLEILTFHFYFFCFFGKFLSVFSSSVVFNRIY